MPPTVGNRGKLFDLCVLLFASAWVSLNLKYKSRELGGGKKERKTFYPQKKFISELLQASSPCIRNSSLRK